MTEFWLKMTAPGPGRPDVMSTVPVPVGGSQKVDTITTPSAVFGYWSSPHGVGVGADTALPVRVMPGPPVNVGWQGTAVWPLQQFCDRPPLESTQIWFAAFVGSGTRATHEPPVQLPGAVEHFVPPQASSCAGTPFASWSRQGLE